MEKPEEFLPIIIHQLRAPLIGIRWSLDSLLSESMGPLNEEQKDILLEDRENVIRLMETIEGMMVMNRQDYYFSSSYPTDIPKVARNVIKELQEKALEKNIEIVKDNLDVPLPRMIADKSKIYIAFENLLENAIKYTPNGGKIYFGIKGDDSSINIEIRDTGIGIPEDQAAKMFSKFFRAKNAVSLFPHGSGVGLYVTKNIIEAHGGKIWFENRKDGPGTAFFITLPYSKEKK